MHAPHDFSHSFSLALESRDSYQSHRLLLRTDNKLQCDSVMLSNYCQAHRDDLPVPDLRYIPHARCSGKRIPEHRQRRSKNAMFDQMRHELGIPSRRKDCYTSMAPTRESRFHHDAIPRTIHLARLPRTPLRANGPNSYYLHSSSPPLQNQIYNLHNMGNLSNDAMPLSDRRETNIVPFSSNPNTKSHGLFRGRLDGDEPQFISQITPSKNGIDDQLNRYAAINECETLHASTHAHEDFQLAVPSSPLLHYGFEYSHSPAKAVFNDFARGKAPLYHEDDLTTLLHSDPQVYQNYSVPSSLPSGQRSDWNLALDSKIAQDHEIHSCGSSHTMEDDNQSGAQDNPFMVKSESSI